MGVSGEGAALRSARKWLLLLCPEIPDQSGGNAQNRLRLFVKAAGCLGRSQRRHGMAYGAAGKKHGVAGAYKRRNTQGRVEGAFFPDQNELAPLHGFVLSWLYTPRRRPSAAVRIAAFGRSLPSAAVDRGSRPSAAAAERGIEIDVDDAAFWSRHWK